MAQATAPILESTLAPLATAHTIAYPEERPFDWERMNRFWEEALSRLKAYVEAEESHDVRPSDAARDRYGTPSD